MSKSRSYRKLTLRLDELRTSLLNFVAGGVRTHAAYSKEELDMTRAYVVLAHAEIEAYCEEIILQKTSTAKGKYDKSGRITPTLRRLVAYHVAHTGKSWQFVSSPSVDAVEKAFNFHQALINKNHGLKSKNLKTLLYPLGVSENSLDPTWLADMDSFGATRGTWAHTSGRMQQPPDPLSQIQTITKLLVGLHQLDENLARLK